MPADRYLVDTNVLIRWVRREAREYRIVNESIQQLARSGVVPCCTSQNLGEFWNVLARPANRNRYGLSPVEANRRAIDVETSLQLLPDSLAVHLMWRELLVEHAISGVQVHDARLVASMLVHGVHRILTFNAGDFTRFSRIEAVHPLQLAGG
ncbi:MAG: PIN domain-containing protein [Terracidiphilus sp.]